MNPGGRRIVFTPSIPGSLPLCGCRRRIQRSGAERGKEGVLKQAKGAQVKPLAALPTDLRNPDFAPFVDML
jgi:hypothetical protein